MTRLVDMALGLAIVAVVAVVLYTLAAAVGAAWGVL